jgi:hypothetical protein
MQLMVKYFFLAGILLLGVVLETSCIQVNAVILYENLTMLDLKKMNANLGTQEWAI